MSNTVVSPSTQSNKATPNSKDALNNLQNAVFGTINKLQKQAEADAIQQLSQSKSGSAGDIINQVISKSRTTAEDKQKIQDQITKVAESHGFGAFSQKEYWTAEKQLADIMICEMIAKEIMNNKYYIAGTIPVNTLVNLYVGKTFGNQAFVKEVGAVVATQLQNYLTVVGQEAINNVSTQLTKQTDQIIHRASVETNKIFSKANDVFYKITKFDLKESLEDAIRDSVSIEGINRKLGNGVIGQILKPSINIIFNSSMNTIIQQVTGSKMMKQIEMVQEQIFKQQEALKRAQQILVEQEAIVRNYINEAKTQAETLVNQYANQIITDISSKIGIELGGVSLHF